MALETVKRMIDEYLRDRSWKYVQTDFYAKNTECVINSDFDFLLLPKRKKFISIEDFYSQTKQFFEKKKVRMVEPIHISEENTDTLFVSAGVQVYNSARKPDSLEGNLFIAQPVVRTQYFGSAKEKEGFCTSFVNVCLEQKDSSENDFITHFDTSLDYLSAMGFYMGDITLKLEERHPNWKNGSFDQLVIKYNYKNLELGDASFLIQAPTSRNPSNICDIGFGLERLVWAANKTTSFFDVIYPGHIATNLTRHQQDILRTSTLIVSSGITPSNSNQGYQLRKFLKDFDGESLDFETLSSCKEFWSTFVKLDLNTSQTHGIICREINRNNNLNLLLELNLRGGKHNPEISQHRFILSLLEKGISFDKIRNAYKLISLRRS